MNGPMPLSAFQLAVAASLLVVNGILSIRLRLGMERRLLVAAARSVLQLSLLAWVLIPVFRWKRPELVGALGLLMIALAAREAVRRSSRSFRGAGLTAFLSMLGSCGLTAVLGSAVVVAVRPWWEPRYLVPLLGMLLGNSLTGISIGLDRCLAEADEGRERIEAMLAFGATRWEAARPVAAEAIRSGTIPILNTMSAVGLVSIPGMMTGQILGGTPPGLAARYQLMILFLIAGATAMGTGLAVLLALRRLFDDQHRLRAERIRRR